MNKKKILIIDDERINLDFFDVMLTRLGFEVLVASDGEEGLSMLREQIPDLIILDNIMPKLTGWELTRMLKRDETLSDYRNIPIIMFSALDAVKDKIEGFELGIEDYIIKPFNFSEVLARIRAVLRSHELSHQVIQRERCLAKFDSFSKTLHEFSQHLEKPIRVLAETARALDVSNTQKVEELREQILLDAKQILSALENVTSKSSEVQQAYGELQDTEASFKEMDERFRERIKELHSDGTESV